MNPRADSSLRLIWVAAFLAAALSLRGEEEMALPEWTESDALRFETPGSVLLGGGLWPAALQPIPEPAPGLRPEGFSRAAPPMGAEPSTEIHVPRIVIRRGGAPEQADHSEHELSLGPAGVVPDEFLAAYFGDRPGVHLVDAQALLSEQKSNDFSRFLEYHDGESEIPIYALIFHGRQELPPEIALREVHERWFGGEQAVLLAYFLGEPKHAILEFGGSATQSLGRDEIGRILESCIDEARVAENAFNQLERFCIELSIRLYWVERTNSMDGPGMQATAEAGAAPAGSAASNGLTPASARTRFAILSLAGCAVALAGVVWLVISFGGFTPRTFVFPIYEIAPRLSAPHSGGAHAVMYFGKRGER